MRAHLPHLLEAYALAHAREYSEDELQQLISFAGSPAGQHSTRDVLEEDPTIQEATHDLWQAATPVMEELRREMCAAEAAKRVAMGDAQAKCPLSGPATTAG